MKGRRLRAAAAGLAFAIAPVLGAGAAAGAEECVSATFSREGNESWQTISIRLENTCAGPVDLDGAVVAFVDDQEIDSVWYSENGQTAYPELALSSEGNTHAVAIAFPEYARGSALTELPGGGRVALHYGAASARYETGSVKVQLAEAPAHGRPSETGSAVAQSARGVTASDVSAARRRLPDLLSPDFRVIGYLPLNWNNAGRFMDSVPPPREIRDAGYTHVLVAFGVFSKNPECAAAAECILLSPTPGESVSIVSGDGTHRQPLVEYIRALEGLGVEVLLSLGGASSHFGTVDFRESFNAIHAGRRGYPKTVDAFVRSILRLVDRYGFDGIDIDIEAGLLAPRTSDLVEAGDPARCARTFEPRAGLTQASGSVCALSSILESLAAERPELTLSLAPQTLNVAPNRQIERDVLNYTALIAQVRPHLDWVGIQLYNTGSMFGPRGEIHAFDPPNQADVSIAMALGLLEPWATGGAADFIDNRAALLRPDQVVLGYPLTSGTASDGSPAADLAQVTLALACFHAPSTCIGIAPRRAPAAGLGGVFGWDLNFDRANGWRFGRSMRAARRTTALPEADRAAPGPR